MSNKNKAQGREAARAQALALQQQQAKKEKRNRFIVFGALGAAILALIIVAGFIIFDEAGKNTVDEGIPLAEVENVPSTAIDGGGVPVGADLAAGTQNEGAPVVDVYLDYLCSHCANFEQINAADVETMASDGEATVVFRPIAILEGRTEYSTRAASAAYWVADQAPEAFMDYNDALFANQPTGGSELDDDELASIAEGAGVPADVAAGIADGTARQTFGQYVSSSTAEATSNPNLQNAEGGFGTPTIMVDDARFDTWNQPGALLAAVQGGDAAAEPSEEPAGE